MTAQHPAPDESTAPPAAAPRTEQPAPIANASTPIIELVLADLDEVAVCDREGTALLRASLIARAEVGLQRYGVRLQAHNGRDAGRDAADEADDLVMYLRQDIEEHGEDDGRLEDYAAAIQLARNLHRRIARREVRP